MTYNLSSIMTAANTYRKAHELTKSEALRAAWLNYKAERINGCLVLLNCADRYTPAERREVEKLTVELGRLMMDFLAIIPVQADPREQMFAAADAAKNLMADAYRDRGNIVEAMRIRGMSVGAFVEAFPDWNKSVA